MSWTTFHRSAAMSWRLIALAFALLFIFAAAVQYNDPDPILWMILYLWPAALCLVYAVFAEIESRARSRALYIAALVTAVIYTTLALLLFPGWLPEWFASEELREAGGLLIAAAACALLAWRLK